ncbi:hypothetical protein [Nocardiopsis alba]|uniref:hypothetical protein n=1 Tax=Nocardiopsis alba TaxID=53437 RepID=UPI00131BFAE4|nr:hypothetical protein [Nocardiopsis alba]
MEKSLSGSREVVSPFLPEALEYYQKKTRDGIGRGSECSISEVAALLDLNKFRFAFFLTLILGALVVPFAVPSGVGYDFLVLEETDEGIIVSTNDSVSVSEGGSLYLEVGSSMFPVLLVPEDSFSDARSREGDSQYELVPNLAWNNGIDVLHSLSGEVRLMSESRSLLSVLISGVGSEG